MALAYYDADLEAAPLTGPNSEPQRIREHASADLSKVSRIRPHRRVLRAGCCRRSPCIGLREERSFRASPSRR